MNSIDISGLYKILENFTDKSATASCIFSFTEGPNKKVYTFSGSVEGDIVFNDTENFNNWDYIFKPKGFNITFAQMEQALKKLDIS